MWGEREERKRKREKEREKKIIELSCTTHKEKKEAKEVKVE